MYTKKIYFSGGDFHELQAVFTDLPGVTETATGYINADEAADYESVVSGKIKARLGIAVTYNPKKIDLSKLMDVLFAVVNPYLPDGQGEARGEMYRVGVFYGDDEDEPQVELHLNFVAARGKAPTATNAGIIVNDPNSNPQATRKSYVTAEPMHIFQAAEPEHQHFLVKNPDAPTYIDLNKFREYVKF